MYTQKFAHNFENHAKNSLGGPQNHMKNFQC